VAPSSPKSKPWRFFWILFFVVFPPLYVLYLSGRNAARIVRSIMAVLNGDGNPALSEWKRGLLRIALFGVLLLCFGSVVLAGIRGGEQAADVAVVTIFFSLWLAALIGPPLWWVFGPSVRFLLRRRSPRASMNSVIVPTPPAPDDSPRRRVDARRKALLDYSLYAPRLGDRFTHAIFDQYVREYMGESHTADEVEHSGRELLTVFERHVSDIEPEKKELTVEGLTHWYKTKKSQVESADLDDRVRGTQMGLLNERYAELMSQLMETMEP
jgi:hypothetical protein